MPFEFISNTSIDREARQRIRSQAAKGKNVGRRHPNRRKRSELRTRGTTTSRSSARSEVPEAAECLGSINSVERHTGNGLASFTFPVDKNPQSTAVVRKVFSLLGRPLYPIEIYNTVNFVGFKSMWVRYLFVDEAYFHCTAAMALTAVNTYLGNQDDSAQAMRHLSHTFRIMNEKLAGEEALSDDTMAVVHVLSHYERMQGQYQQALIHFNAINRMVELRGGISHLLVFRPWLAQKLFRSDLEFALHLGVPTRLDSTDIPAAATISHIRKMFEREPHDKVLMADFQRHLGPEFREILIDILSFCWFLNGGAGKGEKLAGESFLHVFICFGYRLVRLSPLGGPRPASLIDNALHVGLTAYMTTFMLELGSKTQRFTILQRLARSTIQERCSHNKGCQEVIFWLLFIGRATIFDLSDEAWLNPIVNEIAKDLDLDVWEDVIHMLERLPWMKSLHNKSAQALWQRATTQNNERAQTQLDCSLPIIGYP